MFLTNFFVPVVAGEVKLAFAAGAQATLVEVSACSAGARAAKVSLAVNELPVMKEGTAGKKGEPEVFGRSAFVSGEPYHIKKGDIVELVLKGGDEKAPIQDVTIVLTLG
jgi:hypothetical protein